MWTTLTQLVVDTLTRSPHIAETQIRTALHAATPAAMLLIAGGHLQEAPMVLVAGDLDLSITTVSGDAAFSVEENLNPVPGAANAHEWTLHLPTPDPVGSAVSSLVAGLDHLSTDPPSTAAAGYSTSSTTPGPAARAESPLNLQALNDRKAER